MSGFIVKSNVSKAIPQIKEAFTEYIACLLAACGEACEKLCAEVQNRAQLNLWENHPGFFTGLLYDSIFTWISTRPDDFKLSQSMYELVDESKYAADIKGRGLPESNATISAIVGTYVSRYIANQARYLSRLRELSEQNNPWANKFLQEYEAGTLFNDRNLYAEVIEYGSPYNAANPFLENAIEQVREMVSSLLKSYAEKAGSRRVEKIGPYMEKAQEIMK